MKKLLALLLLCSSVHAQTYSTPPYLASNFYAAGSMTWSVPASAVNPRQFRYWRSGSRLEMFFQLENTFIGGTPSNELAIKLPNGATPTGWYSQPVCFAWYIDPVSTSWVKVDAYITTGYPNNPIIGIVRRDQQPWAVWSAYPILHLYCGPIVLDVQ